MEHGIVLSRTRHTWDYVSNPGVAVSDTIESTRRSARRDLSRLPATSVAAALSVALIIGIVAFLFGVEAPLAVIVGLVAGLVVGGAVGGALYSYRRPVLEANLHSEHTGPRRPDSERVVFRGDLTVGVNARMADKAVMSGAKILESPAVKRGALGPVADVFRDTHEVVWALVSQLAVLDRIDALCAQAEASPSATEQGAELARRRDTQRQSLSALMDAHMAVVAVVEQLDAADAEQEQQERDDKAARAAQSALSQAARYGDLMAAPGHGVVAAEHTQSLAARTSAAIEVRKASTDAEDDDAGDGMAVELDPSAPSTGAAPQRPAPGRDEVRATDLPPRAYDLYGGPSRQRPKPAPAEELRQDFGFQNDPGRDRDTGLEL